MTFQTESSAPKMTVAQQDPSVSDSASLRAQELRAEAEATSSRTQKAALLYEAAYLSETELDPPALAINDYLAAYNLDNRFRLPLYALIRLFERKRSLKNLARLYDAQLRAAHTPEEKTTALIDQAFLPMQEASEPEAVRSRLERALEYDEGVEAALLLEWTRRAGNDEDATFEALSKRASGTDDPAQRAVLLLEVARELEERGELSFALEALRKAALQADSNESTLSVLADFARAKGFVPELIEACEKRAELASEELAQGQDADDAVQERLKSRAVAHWYEAARLRCTSLGDPDGALACITRALEIRPDDMLLRQTRMLAFDLMEDRERAAEEARSLLAMGVDGEQAAALHFRLAEHALVAGDLTMARESLMEAIAHAGGSIAADAILDDLLLDEELHRDRIERREARSATANPARASRFLLEAALVAANDLRDPQKALELFQRAEAKADGSPEIAREAYGTGLDLNAVDLTRFGLEQLLAKPLDPEERAALLHHQAELAPLEDARALLNRNIENQEARAFFPQLARLRAAEERDLTLLARSHELLSDQRMEPERAAAHLCAAARAHFRLGKGERAKHLLDRVLANDASHRYAVALQHEILKSLGAEAEIVGLLRRAAEAQTSERDAELSLLMAGAAAEAAGDASRAAQNYEQAAERNAQSVSPHWALLRLGQRQNNDDWVLQARQNLAAREKARGTPGIDVLLLAEHHELTLRSPESVESWLSESLTDPSIGHHAALMLASTPKATAEGRERAVEVLAERVDDAQKPALLAELGGMLLAQGAEHVRVLDIVERTRGLAADDVWALWMRASIPLPHDEEGHAEALEALARVTADESLASNLRAEANLVRFFSGTPSAPSSDQASENSSLTVELAHTVLETTSPAHDAALRARAQTTLLEVQAASRHKDLTSARTLIATGNVKEALSTLEPLLAANSADFQALELAKVAARGAGEFVRLAEICEALSCHLTGDLALALLEEAAVVRMDDLADLRGAEALLVRVLALAPERTLSFHRLQDLLTARGDHARLMELLRDRTERVDDPEELVALFYELARLYRAAGDLDAALDAVDNVRMLDEHVGALALAAEIYTSREAWPEAVEVLQALATARFVPEAQKKLARLGAADFLEHKLKDGAAALAQLEILVENGQPDVALFKRIADVAERIDNVTRAVSALQAAIDLTSGSQRDVLRLRCGLLLAEKACAPEQAKELFAAVLAEQPSHLQAMQALVSVTNEATAKTALYREFEQEVQKELKAAPTDPLPLRKWLALAEARGDAGMQAIALSTLLALHAETPGEREAFERLTRTNVAALRTKAAPLSASELASLPLRAPSVPYQNLFRAVFSAAAEIDQLEPSRFGAARGQRVAVKDALPVRDEVLSLAHLLNLKVSEFYVGGDDPRRIAAMPRDDELAFLVGSEVAHPLTPSQRTLATLQLAATALQTLPLLARSSTQAAKLVYAALVASDCPLPGEILREELGDLPRSLGRALPRKTKKALPELVRALPDRGASMELQLVLALRHTRSVSLLLAGDLASALEHTLGAFPTRDSIAASAEALDLVTVWTSSAMNTLRNRLGLVR